MTSLPSPAWDYMVEYHERKLNEDRLFTLGMAGWELTALYMDRPLSKQSRLCLVLKRPHKVGQFGP